MTTIRSLLVPFALAPVLAFAQAGAEPPPESAPISGDALQAAVSGKTFTYAANTTGTTGRVQYQSGGFVYLNMSTGFTDSGKWRVEDDKLCYVFQRAPSVCAPMRSRAGALFVKRSSDGQWSQLMPQ